MVLVFKIQHDLKNIDFRLKNIAPYHSYNGYTAIYNYKYDFIDVADNEEAAKAKIAEIEGSCPEKRQFDFSRVRFYGFEGYFYTTYVNFEDHLADSKNTMHIAFADLDSDASFLYNAFKAAKHPKEQIIEKHFFYDDVVVDPEAERLDSLAYNYTQEKVKQEIKKYTDSVEAIYISVIAQNVYQDFQNEIISFIKINSLETFDLDKDYFFSVNGVSLSEKIYEEIIKHLDFTKI